MKNATGREQYEVGVQRRKAYPRARLAEWEEKRRKDTPAELLKRSLHDRVPALVPIKEERMACSAFSYFRGAVPVMAYDLSLMGSTGVTVQLCGDAHVENLGTYESPEGSLIFDINDFDESIRGPFDWDVRRMAASLVLAGGEAKLKAKESREAAAVFLGAYCGLMTKLAKMPVLEAARYQVRRLGSVAAISSIFGAAQRATPLGSLDKLTEKTAKGRVFKSAPPLLRRLQGAEAQAVLDALKPYAKTLLPERQHFLAQYRALDVAFKVVGTGSVGLRDYCVYLEGNGARDALFLQVKQEANSAWTDYLPEARPEKQNGKRTADGQRAMQLQSDPMLGWTTIDGRDFLVRQLNDHKASIELTKMKAESLLQYAEVCGEMLARGHARSGDARVIAGYVGNGGRFGEAVVRFAEAYAEQTRKDWMGLVKSRKGGGNR